MEDVIVMDADCAESSSFGWEKVSSVNTEEELMEFEDCLVYSHEDSWVEVFVYHRMEADDGEEAETIGDVREDDLIMYTVSPKRRAKLPVSEFMIFGGISDYNRRMKELIGKYYGHELRSGDIFAESSDSSVNPMTRVLAVRAEGHE